MEGSAKENRLANTIYSVLFFLLLGVAFEDIYV